MFLRCLHIPLALVLAVISFACQERMFTGKREARGIWMSRFEYTGRAGQADTSVGKNIIRAAFKQAREARFNMIFFQVRGNGDAFYRSSIEPWSVMLTGTLGKDPGWDPLEFAVSEAHRQGLELHAWINTFPIWRGATPPMETTPRQVLLQHPEWVVCDSAGKPMDGANNEYIWASPGNPEVRRYVLDVATDIVRRYDIDGIHFDYIRYPEGSPSKGYSHDSVSVERFRSNEGNPNRLSWDHWQREQVNQFVFDAYNVIDTLKPWVKVSAAVIGKYTGEGWTGYSSVYQDPRAWMELEKIDFIVPMVYWERAHPTHPFIPLITQWHDRVSYERQILPGLSSRLQEKFGWSELADEIAAVRSTGLPGVVFFSLSGLRQDWDDLGVHEFPYWSIPPAMPWKDSTAPSPPVHLVAERDTVSIRIHWENPTSEEPLSYIVYRSVKGVFRQDQVMDIVHVTGRNETEFTDHHPPEGAVFYAVSALDRLSNESPCSEPIHVPSPGLAIKDR